MFKRAFLAVVVLTVFCAAKVFCQVTLLDTVADFSLAGEGTNGIQYGYYDSTGSTGNFSTAGMDVNPVSSGGRWEGPGADFTPVFDQTEMHEGVNSSGTVTNSGVKRFTFPTGYAGPVTLSFNIWKVPFGSIGNGADAFITLDDTNIYYQRIPNLGTPDAPYVTQSMLLQIAPGDTLDLGETDSTLNGISDVMGFTATVVTVPEPCVSLLAVASGLVLLSGRRQSGAVRWRGH
jgi:hypothetical protein